MRDQETEAANLFYATNSNGVSFLLNFFLESELRKRKVFSYRPILALKMSRNVLSLKNYRDLPMTNKTSAFLFPVS